MNTKTKLTMTLALAAVALISVVAITTPIQEVSAQDTSFEFDQELTNECSGSASCSNSATQELTP